MLCHYQRRRIVWVKMERRSYQRNAYTSIAVRLNFFLRNYFDMILDHMNDISKICLKSTNSRLQETISVDYNELSRCSKWVIMCRFEEDMVEYPAIVACALCKVKRAQKDFLYNIEFGSQHLDLMSPKPIERYCSRHVGKSLCWPLEYRKCSRAWVRSLELICLHCGSRPVRCGQFEPLSHMSPAGRCQLNSCKDHCAICPVVYLPTCSRLGPLATGANETFWRRYSPYVFQRRLGPRGPLTIFERQGELILIRSSKRIVD